MDAERNFPGIHVRLHAVAFAFADKLLTERLNFGELVAFHDNRELVFCGSGQESPPLAALALEERGKVCDDVVSHVVAELADNRPEIVHFHHQDEQPLARILVLGDVLQVVYQANPVVHVGQRVRRNPVLEEGDIDMQERKREYGVRERNIWDEVLEYARKTGDESDEGEINRFFAVRGVLLRNGVLDADDHRRDDVEQVEPDEEGQKPSEL